MSTAIRLLVAIDGSKSSERTLQALTTQFSPTGTTVRVLNVVEPFTVAVSPQMAAGYTPELEARLKDARALVGRAANTLVFSIVLIAALGNTGAIPWGRRCLFTVKERGNPVQIARLRGLRDGP